MSTNPWQKVQEISTNLHDGLRRLDVILAEANANVEKMMRNDLRAVGLENTPTEHLYDVWQRERAANVGQATIAEQHLGVVQKVPARREVGPNTLVRVNDGQPLTWAAFVGENEQSLHPMDVTRIHGDLEDQGVCYAMGAAVTIHVVERRPLTEDTLLRVDGVPMRWYQLLELQGGEWSLAQHEAIAQALETVGAYGPVPNIRVVKALPPDAQAFTETIRVLLDFAAEDPPADVLPLDIIDVTAEIIAGWPSVVVTLEDGTRFQLRVRRLADAPEVAR